MLRKIMIVLATAAALTGELTANGAVAPGDPHRTDRVRARPRSGGRRSC
jgi:hypothetical protein